MAGVNGDWHFQLPPWGSSMVLMPRSHFVPGAPSQWLSLTGATRAGPLLSKFRTLPVCSLSSRTSHQPGQNFLRNTLQSETLPIESFLSPFLSQVPNLYHHLKALPAAYCSLPFLPSLAFPPQNNLNHINILIMLTSASQRTWINTVRTYCST